VDKATIYETLNKAYFSDTPHEAAVIDHLPFLLRNVTLAVDVGASLGQYSRKLAQTLQSAEIHAVEADPVRFEELQRNCERWAATTSNTVEAHHMAMTDYSGPTTFFVTNSNLSGGLDKPETTSPVEEVEIAGGTLDDLLGGRAPDFVKIDVEGAEFDVLRGGQRILAEGDPTLLVELHGDAHAPTRALLQQLGFHAAPFFGRDVFVKSRKAWVRVVAYHARCDPKGVVQFVRAGVAARLRARTAK
jgi:FkbM family methyltransferase